MFTQLVESKPVTKRSRGGTVVSFVAHYGLILGVIYTSASAASVDDGPREEKVVFVDQPKVEEQPKVEPPPELVVAPPPVKIAPSLIAPVDVPNVLPEIDLTRPPTDPSQFTGKKGPVDDAGSTRSMEPASKGEQPYFDFEVEKPVTQAPNSAVPAYPDMLRQAGVEGEALVSFVVDTLGRVDMSTFKVIRSTHDLFAASVRNALPRMRFIPAETTRGKVRQLVQQPFAFAIMK